MRERSKRSQPGLLLSNPNPSPRMSSFKRRVTVASIPGTKPSPYNSLPLLSTGLTSLDDLLGGGLPLSSTLLLESDSHTSYADLLLKFWIAQGLECKQEVVVVATGLEGGPQEVVRTLMGVDGAELGGGEGNEEDEDGEKVAGEKLKIAFRYEGMKQHAVTAPTRELASCSSLSWNRRGLIFFYGVGLQHQSRTR